MESCMTVQFMGQNSNGGSQFQHVHSKSQALTFHFPIDLPTHTYADTRGLSLMLPWEVFPVRLWLELWLISSKIGSDNYEETFDFNVDVPEK